MLSIETGGFNSAQNTTVLTNGVEEVHVAYTREDLPELRKLANIFMCASVSDVNDLFDSLADACE